MGIAAIFVVFSHNYLAASAMLVSAGLTADHYRLLGKIEALSPQSDR